MGRLELYKMIHLNKFNFSYLAFKSSYSFQTVKLLILFRIIDPLLHYCFFYTLAISIADKKYITYILLGNLVFLMARTMISNLLSMFRSERLFGTLELNVAAPTSLFMIILKKSIIPLLDSLLIFLVSLFMLATIFNISFPFSSLPYVLITVIVGLFSLLGISLLFAGLGLLFTNVNLFFNLTLAIFQIFCGVNFPIDLLPSFLSTLSQFIPITHTVEAFRLLYEGEFQNIGEILQKEIMIGAIYFLISVLLIKFMLNLSKRNGSLFKE
ncbi:hypothetical protein COD96_12840 [Bacillus thuringiensis]|nr:hypothetical protein CON19_07130 [Bacillus thuringiensis]PEY72823.1 hypothetical protein CN355_12685 [Bacillus thuringiensis]PGV69491.1 hypothetical protein COD96_12840 [Bacillus thuringiensis]PGW57426.1 hypothetical protein COE14_11805 [Bacillus thuringiensis]